MNLRFETLNNIEAYTFLNNIAILAVFLFNFLNYSAKKKILGRGSAALIKKLPEGKSIRAMLYRVVIIGIEIFIVSYAQYKLLGPLTVVFGDLFGTGYNYFGGIFLTPVLVAIVCFILGIDIFKQIDLIAPAYPLALTISKIACFCAGCCRGFECSYGMYNYKTEAVEFPVQLVEAGLAFIIFIFLLLRRKKAKEGTLFPTYLILYSATRFFSEFLRIEENVFLILKKYHILCLVGIAIGFIELYVVKNYKEKINQFCEDYNDALAHTLNEIAIRAGLKRKNEIVHHKNKKKQNNTPYLSQSKKDKIANTKKWIIVWTIGLIGQIGWTVEGTWLNTFIYEKIDKNPSIITPMMIMSVLATTASMFILGTLTDRTGKRRNLVSIGFVFWGILTILMGFTQFIPKFSLSSAVVIIIIIDMILSFFASTGSDVGYGTWLTDIMNDSNRGQIGAAIAIQIVLGSLLGNIFGGLLVGNESNYLRLFIVMGTLLSVFGLISVFLFDKKDDAPPSAKGSFTKQLINAFNFKNLLKQKEFIWVNISVMIYFVGYNTYFPHLGNILIQYLGYSPEQVGIIEAVPMILAMFVTMPATKLINKNKFIPLALVSAIVGLIGNLSVFTITPEDVNTDLAFNLRIFIGMLLVGISYIIMLQTTRTWAKSLLPQETKGQSDGFWAIAYALIPTILGSNIGEWIIKNKGEALLNEATGRFEYIPNAQVFLYGAIISTFSIIPILITRKYVKKRLESTCNQ